MHDAQVYQARILTHTCKKIIATTTKPDKARANDEPAHTAAFPGFNRASLRGVHAVPEIRVDLVQRAARLVRREHLSVVATVQARPAGVAPHLPDSTQFAGLGLVRVRLGNVLFRTCAHDCLEQQSQSAHRGH